MTAKLKVWPGVPFRSGWALAVRTEPCIRQAAAPRMPPVVTSRFSLFTTYLHPVVGLAQPRRDAAVPVDTRVGGAAPWQSALNASGRRAAHAKTSAWRSRLQPRKQDRAGSTWQPPSTNPVAARHWDPRRANVSARGVRRVDPHHGRSAVIEVYGANSRGRRNTSMRLDERGVRSRKEGRVREVRWLSAGSRLPDRALRPPMRSPGRP